MATTSGQVLLEYLGQQLAELRRHAPGVLAKQPEDVHQMRVAARRLRSLLASGRRLFEPGAVEPVRAELRWLSALLGAARDPDVVRQRLASLLAQEPEPLRRSAGLTGSAAERIDEELGAQAAEGFAAAGEGLESARYDQLLASLDRLLTDAPLTPEAARDPGKTLGKLVRKDRRRLVRRVDCLPAAADDGTARDAGLHEVRKAAKRLRYSAELAASLPKARRSGKTAGSMTGGKRRRHARRAAKRAAKRARKVQTVLGQHQDSVVARKQLVELAVRAARRGESGFSYGRLHAKEDSLAAASERDFLKLWNRKDPAR